MFAWGTVLQPWYPEGALELQARADYLFQTFNKVDSSSGNFNYRTNDSFLDLSILGALEGYGAELEVVISDTRHHTIYPDCFKLTGRYQVLNDSAGDCVSVIGGVSAILPTTAGLDDISSFHHGHFEGEAHISIGKELICYNSWTDRFWAVGTIGCATDKGSPWLRANFNYEKNWNNAFFIQLFVNTLWGLGGDAIQRHGFEGYGPIAHRSVEVGSKISYFSECGTIYSLGYAYRPYAHNFPKNANLVMLNILYPFNI